MRKLTLSFEQAFEFVNFLFECGRFNKATKEDRELILKTEFSPGDKLIVEYDDEGDSVTGRYYFAFKLEQIGMIIYLDETTPFDCLTPEEMLPIVYYFKGGSMNKEYVDELWENELKEANQWLADLLKSTTYERQNQIQDYVLEPSIKYGLYNEVVYFAYREYKAKASRMALPEFANLTEEEYQDICFRYAMDEWDL